MLARAAAVVLTLMLALGPRRVSAGDDKSAGSIVAVGAVMGVPAYVLGVTWHEGSHALVAKAFGAEVAELQLLPGRHPRTGAFYFGYTSYRGVLTRPQKSVFFLVPRFVDLALLGGYAGMLALDAQPAHDYVALGFAVLATTAWIDFSKDMLLANPANDLMKFHALYGRSNEWRRLPWRVLHVGLSVAAGYAVVTGYARILDERGDGAALALPLASGAF